MIQLVGFFLVVWACIGGMANHVWAQEGEWNAFAPEERVPHYSIQLASAGAEVETVVVEGKKPKPGKPDKRPKHPDEGGVVDPDFGLVVPEPVKPRPHIKPHPDPDFRNVKPLPQPKPSKPRKPDHRDGNVDTKVIVKPAGTSVTTILTMLLIGIGIGVGGTFLVPKFLRRE